MQKNIIKKKNNIILTYVMLTIIDQKIIEYELLVYELVLFGKSTQKYHFPMGVYMADSECLCHLL